MIVIFNSKNTEKLYITGKERKFPQAIIKVALRKLDYLNAAKDLNDLKIPPGNRLESMKGSYNGKYSIRINDQYRIVFKFENSNAYEVELVDYH
ncbi:MAG: type II toxin-antitoxin system RelE/ParE family toxin [Melioribacteraceae bacterium]|nr:type II toxin-antitoxin system RelE/ParE family toxin [Melioribacteraceae bacterium]